MSISPLPHRAILATWPDEWRLEWGRLANEFADSGLPFPADEKRAFAEVSARKAEVEGSGAGRRVVPQPTSGTGAKKRNVLLSGPQLFD
jgi:hypothetical protein